MSFSSTASQVSSEFRLINGKLQFFVATSAGLPFFVTGSTNVADGAWHFVAVVRSLQNTVSLYVDGRLDGRNTASSSITDLLNSVYQQMNLLNIGRLESSGLDLAWFLDGEVDDVRLYLTALTTADLQLICKFKMMLCDVM